MGQIVASGIYWAALYALCGAGIVAVYRSSRILNMAQGDLLVLGVYLTYFFISKMGGVFPMPLILCLSIVVFCLIGLVLYQLFIRPIIGQPPWAGIIATVALGIIIRGIVLTVWTSQARLFDVGISNKVYSLGFGVLLSTTDLMTIGAAVVYFVFLAYFFGYTKTGIQSRGAADNPLLASLNGVNIYFVFLVSWIVGIVGIAMAGILYGAKGSIQPGLWELGILALPAVIVGGIDSLKGLIVGSLLTGITVAVGTSYGGKFLGEVLPMVILLVVLLFRPWGIWGTKEELERV